MFEYSATSATGECVVVVAINTGVWRFGDWVSDARWPDVVISGTNNTARDDG